MPAREPRAIAGTDHVLLPVRWLAVGLLPFLLIAAGILILLPGRVADLFAWPITPPITGMILGAAYIGGILFFAGVLFTAEWHRVRRGFLPVFVFASLLGIATALHTEKFTPNLSFAVWALLYAATPFLVAAAAIAQRSADPGTPASRETTIPTPVAWSLVAVGGVATLTGLAMFVLPSTFIPLWGWDLTPLTARTLGAILSLTGFVNVSMTVDRRWTSFRILYGAQLVSIVFILTAIVVGRSDVHWERPTAWGFVALLLLALGCYGSLTMWAERRMRRAARATERTIDRQV